MRSIIDYQDMHKRSLVLTRPLLPLPPRPHLCYSRTVGSRVCALTGCSQVETARSQSSTRSRSKRKEAHGLYVGSEHRVRRISRRSYRQWDAKTFEVITWHERRDRPCCKFSAFLTLIHRRYNSSIILFAHSSSSFLRML